MKYEIAYTENAEGWKIGRIAAEHGYTKTDDCYWVQIYRNGNGDSIVATRDDESPYTKDDGSAWRDPAELLNSMLNPQPEETTQQAAEADQTAEPVDENRRYCKRIADELEAIAAGQAVNEDGEEMSLYDWVNDALDFEYTVDSQRQYKAAKIWVTLGGPNVWVDTLARAVYLAWGSDRAEYPISYDTADELDNVMAEIWDMGG